MFIIMFNCYDTVEYFFNIIFIGVNAFFYLGCFRLYFKNVLRLCDWPQFLNGLVKMAFMWEQDWSGTSRGGLVVLVDDVVHTYS